MMEFFALMTLSLISAISQEMTTDNSVNDSVQEIRHETSWERICFNKKDYVNIRVIRYGSTMLLDLKHMHSWKSFKRYSLKEDDKLIITFEDDNTVILYNIADIHSTTGGGAVDQVGLFCRGVNPTYPIPTADTAALKNKSIKKISMHTSDELIEFEPKRHRKELVKNLMVSIAKQ